MYKRQRQTKNRALTHGLVRQKLASSTVVGGANDYNLIRRISRAERYLNLITTELEILFIVSSPKGRGTTCNIYRSVKSTKKSTLNRLRYEVYIKDSPNTYKTRQPP